MSRVRRSSGRWFLGLLKTGEVFAQVLHARHYFEDWRRLFVTYAGFREFCAGETFTLRVPTGGKVKVWEPSDILNLWSIFCGEEYRVYPSDAFVLDVGANVGMFASYVAVVSPRARIEAYEPVARTHERLVRQMALSKIEKRVVCRNLGVGSQNGEREIYIGQSSDTSSLYLRNGASAVKESVRLVSLTSVIEEIRDCPVSLLKMDCEGAEWEILGTIPGKSLSNVERICLEYHPLPGHDKHELVSRLAEMGYTLSRLKERRNRTGVVEFVR